MSKVDVYKTGDIEIIQGSEVDTPTPAHFHDDYEIALVKKGAIKFSVHNERFHCAPNTLIIVNPQEVHAAVPDRHDGWHFQMLFISVEQVTTILQQMDIRVNQIPSFKNWLMLTGGAKQPRRQ